MLLSSCKANSWIMPQQIGPLVKYTLWETKIGTRTVTLIYNSSMFPGICCCCKPIVWTYHLVKNQCEPPAKILHVQSSFVWLRRQNLIWCHDLASVVCWQWSSNLMLSAVLQELMLMKCRPGQLDRAISAICSLSSKVMEANSPVDLTSALVNLPYFHLY